ncbi:far upstream element-binding protein 1-like isoform X1 [Canna indica]|uniref:Far upstream element-binding protein 1-like isoform X1 n=1 Tax=Canna indica TaxID=4628 RepID=A0AAQ3K3D0_9LILI|nr:far upstream element-binding protein 1-like isoform X1 [Canna indica]
MADSEVEVSAAQAVPDEQEAEAAGGAEAPKGDAAAAVEDIETPTGDRKRKLEDLEPHEEDNEAPLKKQESSTEALEPSASANESGPGDGEADAGGLVDGSGAHPDGTLAAAPEEVNLNNSEHAETEIGVTGDVRVEADPQENNPDGEINDSVSADTGKDLQSSETMSIGNGQVPPGESAQVIEEPPSDLGTTSHKIEVPNNKVGVLIGKAGETIRYLQFNSGAKIQITRDAESDPNSTTRPVELIGSVESISKAEKLIKDVIAEADAGGSPSLVARGFSTIQSGGEQFEIKVPNEKVGLIIGKGGETIKNLQTRSGARIQLIPQHLPEGDASKERTVRITGDKKQIETAKEMIKEVMNQTPIRPSPLSGYSQQNYRPRGHSSVPHWGGRASAPAQPTMGYDYQQRGNYPPQTTQYPPPYGGYSGQAAPRGGFSGSSWDQRPSAPGHNTPSGGYDYYSQGAGTQASMPNPISGPTPAPGNYGQSQAPNYGHPAPYGQAAPTQNYGHGYNEPRYDSQAPNQQFYGQQNMGSQPGVYGQGTAHQSGYGQQQPYAKTPYGVPQDGTAYGVPPRASQPGDPAYQGPAPSSYGSAVPTQQYPYGSNPPSQPAPSYNQGYGPSSGMDGYGQPPSAAYAQPGMQAGAPAYGQGGQPVPGYNQPNTQPAGYSQYPSSQQGGYGDPASGNVNYGYQGGSSDPLYGAPPVSGYAAPPAGSQPGYPQQQATNQSGYYDQSATPQAGYGSHPGNAPAYTKSVSPQPAYGTQYDSTQMYAHH